MVEVRIERKPEFKIAGRKIWISGTDNEIFGDFWKRSHEDGLVEKLREIHRSQQETVMNSPVFGVSCVEKDPSNRSFYFFIAAECKECPKDSDLEEYTVPACEWAVFRNVGTLPFSLVESEMYAYTKWLPNSKYIHANAPEIEAYPPSNEKDKGTVSEYWLPITEK